MSDEPRDQDARDSAGRAVPVSHSGGADHTLELEADDSRLLRLLGTALEDRLKPDRAQARTMDWLARDARLTQSPAERMRGQTAAARFADSILASRSTRRAIARSGLRCISGSAEQRRPRLVAPVEQAVRAAYAERCAPLVDLRVAAGLGRTLWDQACERWVVLPPRLPRGRYLALGVTGDSMLPLLAPGDTILVRLGDAVAGGSIVVARARDDDYVVKQVAGVTARGLELHSLNPAYAPMVIAPDAGVVLGTVMARWRG